MRETTIRIAHIARSGICVASADGHKVHEHIFKEIKAGRRVILSFEAVTRLTTAFLNAAIGQLYGEFDEDTLRRHLAPPLDANSRQLTQLKLVVDRAKEYFRDPEHVKTTFQQITGMDDE